MMQAELTSPGNPGRSAARWTLGTDGVPRLIPVPQAPLVEDSPAPSAQTPQCPSFWQACIRLIGYVSATAVVFLTLFALGWLVSLALGYLDSVHRLPPVFRVAQPDVWLLYADAAFSSIVLLCGLARFVRDTGGH